MHTSTVFCGLTAKLALQLREVKKPYNRKNKTAEVLSLRLHMIHERERGGRGEREREKERERERESERERERERERECHIKRKYISYYRIYPNAVEKWLQTHLSSAVRPNRKWQSGFPSKE